MQENPGGGVKKEDKIKCLVGKGKIYREVWKRAGVREFRVNNAQ